MDLTIHKIQQEYLKKIKSVLLFFYFFFFFNLDPMYFFIWFSGCCCSTYKSGIFLLSPIYSFRICGFNTP